MQFATPLITENKDKVKDLGKSKTVLGFLLLLRDTVTTATLTKEKHLIGIVYIFRSSVHYHHDKGHGGVQGDMVLATS